MPSILAVVVLYNTSFAASRTLQGLQEAFARDPGLLEEYRILLWDNSAVADEEPGSHFPCVYRHSRQNAGVSGAYNAGMTMASADGTPWLLLLDHDTDVTGPFLRGMAEHAQRLQSQTEIAAVTPFLYAGTTQLSPRYVRFNRHVPIPASCSGVERRRMFAANSGCLMRVAVLQDIGGYSPDFWLDYSDIYVFHRFRERKKAVYLAPELRLQHDIAMLDYDNRMTPERYRNYLAAEGAFHDLYKGRLENAAQFLRLAVRAVRQRRYRNPEFSRLTWRALRERLLRSRASRIAQWKQGKP